MITAISRVGGNTRIQGTLNSTPNTQFRVELFANDEHDPSGFGEGQTFLAFINVTTDPSGNATIDFTTTGLIPAGRSVTATATNPANNTSEFSNALCSLIVTHTGDGGFGSLRQAIICANDTPGPDTITVPAGTYTLTIAGADENGAATGDLDITDDLTINGAGLATTIIQAGALGHKDSGGPNGIDRVFHHPRSRTATGTGYRRDLHGGHDSTWQCAVQWRRHLPRRPRHAQHHRQCHHRQPGRRHWRRRHPHGQRRGLRSPTAPSATTEPAASAAKAAAASRVITAR